jgi:hypothetical protein
MNDTLSTEALIEQARRVLAAHDESARVEYDPASGGLRVKSRLDAASVLRVLQSNALPVATVRSPHTDCCGGCGG